MGWAITDAEREEDMALIEELGATIIRLAHYQHSDHFHSLADRAGMVLWSEIPLVNEMTDSTAFRANARQQMTELIRQNYNHPSILFWGIGNEQRNNNAPTNNLLDELAALTHGEDPGRLVTYAHCCSSDSSGLPAHSDVVGYNTYYGWYDNFGAMEDFGAWADGLHATRPDWNIGVSEYGAGASVVQHQDPPSQPDPYGSPHPEEWQNLVHEVHWQQMSTRPYLWSKIVWTMFDFASDGRRVGNSSAPLLSEFRDGRWAASVSRAREWEWAVAWIDEPCAVGCRSPRIAARSWRKRVAWPSPEAGVGGGWPKRGARVRQARRRARLGRQALRRGANVGAPLASGNRAGRGAGPFEAPRWVRSAFPAAGAGFADGSGTP